MMTEKQEAAVIDKEDIAVLGALKGMANHAHVVISGTSYGPGEIVFNGFAGRIHLDDRRYHGAVIFLKRDGEAERADFSPILRAMDINESEVGDELHSEDN